MEVRLYSSGNTHLIPNAKSKASWNTVRHGKELWEALVGNTEQGRKTCISRRCFGNYSLKTISQIQLRLMDWRRDAENAKHNNTLRKDCRRFQLQKWHEEEKGVKNGTSLPIIAIAGIGNSHCERPKKAVWGGLLHSKINVAATISCIVQAQ